MAMIQEPFGLRVQKALDDYGNLCVGIDPHPALLQQWGLPDSAAGVKQFALTVLEACHGKVGIVKPQSAFFERFGSRGIAVLEEVLAEARTRGLLCILDVKRGDIGSTMAAYAQAYLEDGSPLAADAITVSPYLGVGALDETFELAKAFNRGLYVLGLTSNPEGKFLQTAKTETGLSVAKSIIFDLSKRNAEDCDEHHLGAFGAVIGATTDKIVAAENISFEDFNGSFLVPGLGAQGGSPVQVRAIFGAQRKFAIASASRSILKAGPQIGELQRAIDITLKDVEKAVS